MKWRTALPLPGFVLHPFTALTIAIVHVYLSFGHLSKLFSGDVQWTHVWKGFGALAGAYVFAALAQRGFARQTDIRSSGLHSQCPMRCEHEGRSFLSLHVLIVTPVIFAWMRE